MAAVLIKKYGNRRLYDTGDSKYVTLEELAAKLRSGVDLRVIDAQTNDDLTQSTLVQIVLESGNAAKFLPVQLLTQMIRLSDDALAEFFSRYVTGALDLYLNAKRGVQSISAYNPLAQLPVAATDALTRMWMGSPFAPGFQQPYGYTQGPSPYNEGFRPAPPPDLDVDEADLRAERTPTSFGNRSGTERNDRSERGDRGERKSSPAMERRPGTERGAGDDRSDRGERSGERSERKSSPAIERGRDGNGSGNGDRNGSGNGSGNGDRNGSGNGDRNGSGNDRNGNGDREDVAAMRRELDELKQAIRDGLSRAPRKTKRKP